MKSLLFIDPVNLKFNDLLTHETGDQSEVIFTVMSHQKCHNQLGM